MKYEVSLMDEKMIEYNKTVDGLCTKKFHANIITKNIDYSKLKVGDVIKIDNKTIEIQKVGKNCFVECSYENKPCLLSKNVAFGRIL